MKCPLCKQADLMWQMMDVGLASFRCEQCGGVWISALEYQKWMRGREQAPVKEPSQEEPLAVSDTATPKFCPDCKHMLVRYRFSPDIKFYLDRCGGCHGVWFDRNEWETLVAHNLHDKVPLFFTEPWQSQMRAEETRRQFERIYLTRFGEADYARLQEIRAWIYGHPQQQLLLAYLTDRDPYKV